MTKNNNIKGSIYSTSVDFHWCRWTLPSPSPTMLEASVIALSGYRRIKHIPSAGMVTSASQPSATTWCWTSFTGGFHKGGKTRNKESCPCPWRWGWIRWSLKVPSNPNHSMILWILYFSNLKVLQNHPALVNQVDLPTLMRYGSISAQRVTYMQERRAKKVHDFIYES